jgi:hypothetical protein
MKWSNFRRARPSWVNKFRDARWKVKLDEAIFSPFSTFFCSRDTRKTTAEWKSIPKTIMVFEQRPEQKAIFAPSTSEPSARRIQLIMKIIFGSFDVLILRTKIPLDAAPAHALNTQIGERLYVVIYADWAVKKSR